MSVNSPKELFVKMLSDVRARTERMTEVYQELSGIAQDPSVKEALESRIFLQDKALSSLDRCFKLIGEKPVQLSGRVQEVVIEDVKRELAEIQAPAVKALYVLIKANHLMPRAAGRFRWLQRRSSLLTATSKTLSAESSPPAA